MTALDFTHLADAPTPARDRLLAELTTQEPAFSGEMECTIVEHALAYVCKQSGIHGATHAIEWSCGCVTGYCEEAWAWRDWWNAPVVECEECLVPIRQVRLLA